MVCFLRKFSHPQLRKNQDGEDSSEIANNRQRQGGGKENCLLPESLLRIISVDSRDHHQRHQRTNTTTPGRNLQIGSLDRHCRSRQTQIHPYQHSGMVTQLRNQDLKSSGKQGLQPGNRNCKPKEKGRKKKKRSEACRDCGGAPDAVEASIFDYLGNKSYTIHC